MPPILRAAFQFMMAAVLVLVAPLVLLPWIWFAIQLADALFEIVVSVVRAILDVA